MWIQRFLRAAAFAHVILGEVVGADACNRVIAEFEQCNAPEVVAVVPKPARKVRRGFRRRRIAGLELVPRVVDASPRRREEKEREARDQTGEREPEQTASGQGHDALWHPYTTVEKSDHSPRDSGGSTARNDRDQRAPQFGKRLGSVRQRSVRSEQPVSRGGRPPCDGHKRKQRAHSLRNEEEIHDERNRNRHE